MNSIFSKIRDKHALWYKGFVFIFSVTVCAYLLPKTTSWKTTHVNIGDVWTNDDLISPIDFLVKKTSADLESENNNRAKEILYFKKQPVNSSEIVSSFSSTSNKNKALLIECIDSIYSVGVYLPDNNALKNDSLLYLVSNNEVLQVHKKHLFNKESIFQLLKRKGFEDEIINHMLQRVISNVIYDEVLSNEINSEKTDSTFIYKSKINKGEVLLSKNDVITQKQKDVISSYNNELIQLENKTPLFTLILGQLLTCILILGIMMLFLAFFRKAIFSQNTHVTFIFLIILIIVLASNIVCRYNKSYVYAVPYCLVPILIRIFFDSRTSLFNFLNVILLCSFFTSDKFEFVFIQLIAGIGTIFSVADMGKRSKLFISALLTFVFYILAFVAYHLINQTQSLIYTTESYIPLLISSVCVLFSFPLIFLFEKLFGFISDFTLLELCDLNSPLLRQLSQKIPGTFQHSLQVANLAEEACYKIGGNALLVRTGAMYHDIGKMDNPRFFTENQVGEVSPHADLSPEESAKIIIDHVIKGIEKAKEYELPETVIDFIRTHHGTTTTRFFLHNYKKAHEGEVINDELFRYPGPIPFSKETAILMMADSVEASSRSLKKYDAITIDELVDKIIDHQIAENQFINADITFRDINQIKKIFKKRLMNIYHVRIEYPR